MFAMKRIGQTSRISAHKREYNNPPKPLFHLHPGMHTNISMADAEMAIETCMNIPLDERDECYVAFGVDGRAIEEYYYIVEGMEKALYSNSYYKNRTDPIWMCRVKEQLRILYNARFPRTVQKE